MPQRRIERNGISLQRTIGGWVGVLGGRIVLFRQAERGHYRWSARAQGGTYLARGRTLTECIEAAR